MKRNIFYLVFFICIFKGQKNFLTYLPYEGTFNQLLSLENGLSEAKRRKRILFIPPLTPSQHDKHCCLIDWNVYFDFKQITKEIGADMFFISTDKALFEKTSFFLEIKDKRLFECFSYGKWKNMSSLGITSKNYIDYYFPQKKFLITQTTELKSKQHPFGSEIKDKNKIMCISQTMHLIPEERIDIFSWISFTDYVKKPVSRYFESLKRKYSDKQNIMFLGVHWRRGDFEAACRNKPVFTSCWQDKDYLQREIQKKKEKGVFQITILITNEQKDISFPEKSHIHIFKIDSDLPSENLSVIFDFYLMTKVDVFLGNRHSTISRLIERRRKREKKKTIFF